MTGLVEYLRDFLVRYEYPSADLHDDSRLSDVFLAPNRSFLLSWTLGVYLGGPPVDGEALPERLVEMGFVDGADGEAFALAQMEPERELQVFRNMFEFVRAVKEPPPEVPRLRERPSLDEYLRTRDASQAPSQPEPLRRIDTGDRIPTSEPDTTYRDTLLEIDSEMRQLEGERRQIIEMNESPDDTAKLTFPPDFPSTVASCKTLLEDLRRYMEDVRTVEDFVEAPPVDLADETGRSDVASFLEDVAEKLTVIREIRGK